MNSHDRTAWSDHVDLLYGPLTGQRGLDTRHAVRSLTSSTIESSPKDLIIALHTFFAFCCEFIASAFASGSPATFAKEVTPRNDQACVKAVNALANGTMLESMGFCRPTDRCSADWFVGGLDRSSLKIWTDYLRSLATLSESYYADIPKNTDFVGDLYSSTVPKNIRHALGEFYTPKWLADYIVERLQPHTEETVVDPFCGSGVFLLAALDRKVRQGLPAGDALGFVLGLDVNPIACAMARTNLVIALTSNSSRPTSSPVDLPVLCTDSIAPSLRRARHGFPSLLPSLGSPADQIPYHRASHQTLDDDRLLSHLHPRWSLTGPSVTLRRDINEMRRHPQLDKGSQLAYLAPANYVATNPPWIGWEYQAPQMRTHVQPAWDYYRLCPPTLPHRAFLKEDISTLATVAAWDIFLADRGSSGIVVRSTAMTSAVASSGLRRLSLYPGSMHMCLSHVDVLDQIRVFSGAKTEASVWFAMKGESTSFPVDCHIWRKRSTRWQPTTNTDLSETMKNTLRTDAIVSPSDRRRPLGRWTIGSRQCAELSQRAVGPSAYRARIGVFTGGANAVYYLSRVGPGGIDGRSVYRNLVQRVKRTVAERLLEIEDDCVFPVIRGRDLGLWHVSDLELLLCPHTAATRMDAISPLVMAQKYPFSLRYLESMKDVLDARRGFTKWEDAHRKRAFYALQRIGPYTFSAYKVCWKYISKGFVAAVVGPNADNRPVLPNDKVVSISVRDSSEAYYLCGLLSSSPIRWQIAAQSGGRQMSASCIESIRIPMFQPANGAHRRIADFCKRGHELRASDSNAKVAPFIEEIDQCVAQMYGWSQRELAAFQTSVSH